jgi:hypothetical protein
LDRLHTLFADHRLGVLDRHAFIVHQMLNAAQEQHIGGAIIPASSGPLYRLDLIESAFPEP